MTVPVTVAAAYAAADLVADLLEEMSDEEARIIWQWSGFPGQLPGREARRVVLRVHALDEGWRLARPRPLRRLMRRAVMARDLRGLRLLVLLLVTQSAAHVAAYLRGRDAVATPRAGHGSVAPARGSPFGRFALALPGSSPD